MPFPTVLGIPGNTDKVVLRKLRREIVRVLSENIPGLPKNWTHPFFLADLLDEDPLEEEDGASTIYVRLDTAMFHGKTGPKVDSLITVVLFELAQVVWNAFNGKYDVEVFIGDLKWKYLKKQRM